MTAGAVLVADDHPLYREGIARAVREHPELDLVAECADGPEALSLIREKAPAVAVLDLQLPGCSGLEVLRTLQAEGRPTRVMILSAHTAGALVYEAATAGAGGYLSKDADRTSICEAIAAVASGKTVFPGEIGASLVEQLQAHSATPGAPLTPREREILALLADGRSAPEIAGELYLSQTTVKTHLRNVYDKLGVSDRAAAVAQAMRRGLLN